MKLIQEIIKTDIAATSARLKGKCGENDKRTLCERANYFLSEKYLICMSWLAGSAVLMFLYRFFMLCLFDSFNFLISFLNHLLHEKIKGKKKNSIKFSLGKFLLRILGFWWVEDWSINKHYFRAFLAFFSLIANSFGKVWSSSHNNYKDISWHCGELSFMFVFFSIVFLTQ